MTVFAWLLALRALAAADYAPMVAAMAAVYEVSPRFAQCVCERESNWNHQAIGSRGERGLWQFRLSTWRELRKRQGADVGDYRNDPFESTRTALWAFANGYERLWTTARGCR